MQARIVVWRPCYDAHMLKRSAHVRICSNPPLVEVEGQDITPVVDRIQIEGGSEGFWVQITAKSDVEFEFPAQVSVENASAATTTVEELDQVIVAALTGGASKSPGALLYEHLQSKGLLLPE